MIKLNLMIEKEHRCKIRAWLDSISPLLTPYINNLYPFDHWNLKGLFSILIALNLTTPRFTFSLHSSLPPSFTVLFVCFCVTLQFWEFDFAYEPCPCEGSGLVGF